MLLLRNTHGLRRFLLPSSAQPSGGIPGARHFSVQDAVTPVDARCIQEEMEIVEPTELETELKRFLECGEAAGAVLWGEDPIQVRPYRGPARCGDMLVCWDGVERRRLCWECAGSPALEISFARYAKWKPAWMVHRNQP